MHEILFSLYDEALMAKVIEGNKMAEEILSELAGRVAALKLKPVLLAVLVGDNSASSSYLKTKQKKAGEIGIEIEIKRYPEAISQEELEKEIEQLNKRAGLSGILVQLPLPKHLNKQKILDSILPELDIDCLTTVNKVKLSRGEKILYQPPAAAAVLKILEEEGVDLREKNILIVGSGDLVGKPISSILLNRGLDFELANRYTDNLPELLAKADLVITGVGKAGLVKGEMIKEGAIVIDAGTTGSEEGVKGDVEFETAKNKASLIAPVPGGVGPVTIAMLLQNVVESAAIKQAGI